MNILIAGATGLVGGYVLKRALADDRVEKVVAPTRRPLPPHPKLLNPVSEHSTYLSNADWWAVDGVVCTLGTTRAKAGSDEGFRAIDFDLQLAVAHHSRARGVQRFALTSSMDANPSSRFLYLRTKGELEEAVKDLNWPSLTIVRPGAILGDRVEKRSTERILGIVLRMFSPVLPASIRGNPADQIAHVLFEAIVNGAQGTRLIEAGQIA